MPHRRIRFGPSRVGLKIRSRTRLTLSTVYRFSAPPATMSDLGRFQATPLRNPAAQSARRAKARRIKSGGAGDHTTRTVGLPVDARMPYRRIRFGPSGVGLKN
ncbi:uncharacterized protein LOC112590031 isoform X2 [Harpegnathos saltator]|nr:uncharacterized protein LOC112590031 isoform X2 [Harpegnathos saltator]